MPTIAAEEDDKSHSSHHSHHSHHSSSSSSSYPTDDTAFLQTEVELSKAKRLYHNLEKRLEQERDAFTTKSKTLSSRVFDLETRLHQSKVEGLALEEEALTQRTLLENEGKRQRARNSVLEEELRSTKEAWVQRLADERKGWQRKVTEKVVLLQGQIDETRSHYTAQIQGLQEELREALTSRCLVQEELDVTKALLKEENAKRQVAEVQLEEFKGKYRRCMELAAELIAVRGGDGSGGGGGGSGKKTSSGLGGNGRSSSSGARGAASSSSSHTASAFANAGLASVHLPSSTTRPVSSFRLSSENDVLKKQLKLTQVLLDEELRKNHSLRQSLARLSV